MHIGNTGSARGREQDLQLACETRGSETVLCFRTVTGGQDWYPLRSHRAQRRRHWGEISQQASPSVPHWGDQHLQGLKDTLEAARRQPWCNKPSNSVFKAYLVRRTMSVFGGHATARCSCFVPISRRCYCCLITGHTPRCLSYSQYS